MSESITCCLCGAKHCDKSPFHFKERKNGGGWSSLRHLNEEEFKKFLSIHPHYEGGNLVGEVVCIGCRKKFKDSPKKRKIDKDFAIIELQRQRKEREEKKYLTESRLEAERISFILT